MQIVMVVIADWTKYLLQILWKILLQSMIVGNK